MRSTLPFVKGDRLYRAETDSDPIVLGTPEWFDWLEQHTAFQFVAARSFTARRSTMGTMKGTYWIAYRNDQGKLNRHYLGYSESLTQEKLESAARAIAGEPVSEEPDAGSLTPSPSPMTSIQAVPGNTLAVDHATALLQTKLYRPRKRSDLISRARLLERLHAGLSNHVTLVSAPAGYGKSTLLGQWVETVGRPTAWLSLDERDNEPRVFVQSLTAALQSAFPDMLQGLAGLVQARSFPPAIDFVSLFITDLADVPADVVLVLDDYHLIHNPDIHTLIDLLIEHQPPQLHLVLSTRSDPPFPLARWRALGYLNDLRPTDLRFTNEETEAFLTRVLGNNLAPELVAELEELTEGWIAVLRLATLSLRNTVDQITLLERLRSYPDTSISNYLLEEILNQQVPLVQAFLIRVSLLEQFCTELCVTLLGSYTSYDQGQAILNWLERSDVLVIPLDDRQGWYRFHHLFQTVLQERLTAQVSTEEIVKLHLRAGRWYAERGLIEEAIKHALAAGDVSSAANLVEAHFLSAFKQQNLVALERWLHLLPEEQIQRSPELLFARAWILQIHGQITDIPGLLKDAEQLLATSGSSVSRMADPHSRLLYALNALFWSFLQYFAGQVQESLENARSALAWLPRENVDIMSLVMQFLAWSCQACGLEEVAHHELRQAMEELSAYPILTARLLFAQAWVYLATGKLQQVEHTARHLLRCAQEADLIVSQQFAHWLLGVVYYEWNNLDSAKYHFSVVIANQHQAHFWVAQDSLRGLTLVYQAKGVGTQAQETSRVLLSLVEEQHNMGQLTQAYAFCGQLALLQDEVEQAEQWLEMAGEQEVLGPMMFLEDPPITIAWMLLAKGDEVSVASGQALLDKLLLHVESMHNTRKTIQVLALQAWAYDLNGYAARALDVLEHALTLAFPNRFMRTFVNLPPLARLIHELSRRHEARREIDRKLDVYILDLLAAMNTRVTPSVSPEALLQQEDIEPLTRRELHILRLLEQDLTNKEIARELVLTTGTVKVHTSNIYRKLNVNNRRAAVSLAKALGLLTTDRA